jgi:glycosyltransferase involved in cell wall biosynthesis
MAFGVRSNPEPPLVVIETHPVQYHAPVYRALQQQFGVPVTAVYGSDFSVAGYRDREFGEKFAWDSDLVGGYSAEFLARQEEGGPGTAEETTTRGLADVLRRLQPAAILLLGYSPRFYWHAFAAARRTGCPLLFRAETTDHARSRSRLKSWLRDRMLKSLYRRCARLLYVGKRSRLHYERLGCTDEQLLFSPYCVDLAPFRPSESDRDELREPTRQALGVLAGKKIILFSGKLSRRKGVDMLMQAVKHLPDDVRKQIVLVFLGNGELRGELEACARSVPEIATWFVGFQNQTRLSSYYHAADLLVLPSIHSETWGLVVNESLHHGVPAVVSEAVGCAPDLIEPGVTGEVCAAGSVSDLAAAIARALSWSGLERVRSQCRARIAAYTIERAAEGIALAFSTVTGQPAVRPSACVP